jgi:hypothetical protein
MYIAPLYQTFDSTVESDLNAAFRNALSEDLFVDPSFELASFSFGAVNAMADSDKLKEAYDTKYKYGLGENGRRAMHRARRRC